MQPLPTLRQRLIMKITAKDIIEYRKRLKTIKTIGDFKTLGREIRDRHELTDKESLGVLQNNLDIILEVLK